VAWQPLPARQSAASLMSAHGGGTSHAAIGSHASVQQPFAIVGTSPVGQVGGIVVHVSVPLQLPLDVSTGVASAGSASTGKGVLSGGTASTWIVGSQEVPGWSIGRQYPAWIHAQ
jgi:hypothetical protein